MTFELAKATDLARLVAIDYEDIYVEAARAKNHDRRVEIERGDACALRFPDASFERCFAMLDLHFVPQPELAVAEMRRVTRPGGTVAAAVWDAAGGMPAARVFWDTAAMLEQSAAEARARVFSLPVVRPAGLTRLFRDAGLVDVDERSLALRMDYENFDDYWLPHLSGEGGIGAFLATLSPKQRQRLRRHVRSAYLAGSVDGPRSFTAAAWSCRGNVPINSAMPDPSEL